VSTFGTYKSRIDKSKSVDNLHKQRGAGQNKPYTEYKTEDPLENRVMGVVIKHIIQTLTDNEKTFVNCKTNEAKIKTSIRQ